MNKLARALGKWLVYPYQCRVCKKKMNIHDGLILDPKDVTRVIHKGCKNGTNSNYTESVRKVEGSF